MSFKSSQSAGPSDILLEGISTCLEEVKELLKNNKTKVGVVEDPESSLCGKCLFVDGMNNVCYFDFETQSWVVLEGENLVSISSINWNDANSDISPIQGQVCVPIPAGTDDTAENLIAAAIAAEAPTGTTSLGADYAFTIDDVSSFSISMTGNCPVSVKGINRIKYDDTAEGGVTIDVPVVTTETDAELTVCFAKRLTNDELKALGSGN